MPSPTNPQDIAPSLVAERRAVNRNERTARYCPCCLSADLARSPAVLMPFVADRALGWAPVRIDETWGLRTIASGHAYSICNSVECGACGMVFLDIRFTDAELGRLYDDYRGEAYTVLREHYEPCYRARNDSLKAGIAYLDAVEDFLRPHVPLPVRMLDWGGDTGQNSPFKAQASPFHIHDISRAPPIPGAAFVTRDQIDPASYDLIVCSNVLEHIPHPIDLLEEIAGCMTDATVLYLEIPFEAFMARNQDNPRRLAEKRHWHEHVNFFSRTSLAPLCANAGLSVADVKLQALPILGPDAYIFQLACRRAAR
jgi:hypothetical protein